LETSDEDDFSALKNTKHTSTSDLEIKAEGSNHESADESSVRKIN
jgi:hypothetical protein